MHTLSFSCLFRLVSNGCFNKFININAEETERELFLFTFNLPSHSDLESESEKAVAEASFQVKTVNRGSCSIK